MIQDGLDTASLTPLSLLEAFPQGVVLRTKRGRTVYANQAAVRLLGMESRYELLDVPLEDLPELRIDRETWARLVTGDGPGDVLFGDGAGGERWMRVGRGELTGDDGEPLDLLVLDDVSEQRWTRDRERFVAEAAEELARSLDFEASTRSMARLAVPLLADWCSVELLQDSGRLERGAVAHADSDRERWAAEDERRFPSAASAPGLADLERPGLVADLATWLATDARGDERRMASLRMLEVRSAAIVPLRARGRLLGALTLVTAESGRVYSGSDLVLFERLADRCALALDNARLFRDQQSTAARLQRSLRPRSLPSVPRFDVAALYRPLGEGAQAGGDFYDLFPAARGEWVATLGDVSGKGTGAAATSALMRHTLRAAATGPGRLPRALALADEILHAEDEGSLCSAVLARLTSTLGRTRLTMANAGHPPPLVVKRDGTTVLPRTSGSILGVSTSRLTREVAFELEPGEALVMYTDGVTEARVDGELFGEERLREILRPCGGEPAETIVTAIRRALVPPVELRDDVAVMVIAAPETR